jgi:hypothetical protein
MATPNLSEIVTTTIESRSGKLADNVSKNHALLDRLEKKGKRKPVSGGRQIIQELEYGENGTFNWYSGYDPLNISPSEVFSAAQFDWKQASVAVSISGLEELHELRRRSASSTFWKARIENAERTMKNSDGHCGVRRRYCRRAVRPIGGLGLLVPDDSTTGTVGGISRVNWTFWQSQEVRRRRRRRRRGDYREHHFVHEPAVVTVGPRH